MGYYIDGPARGKAEHLIGLGAIECDKKPARLADVPEDKALICVTSNGIFDAAGLVFDDAELRAFSLPHDHRPKRWLLMDKATAHLAAGYGGRL